MTHETLRSTAITALAEYVGVAAEFFVEDAMDEMAKNQAFSKNPKLQEMYFFVCLGKLLPTDVPYATLKIAITKAIAAKS
jgi:hypothetical protein